MRAGNMKKKVLVLGPSDTKSHGGVATMIAGIRNSNLLNDKYDITIFPTYIDGCFIKRYAYNVFAFVKFFFIYKNYDLFHIHTASYGSTFRKRQYLKLIKASGRKTIVHVHSGKYIDFYEKVNEKGKRKINDFLNSADLVITLSEGWKEKFESTFGLKNCISLPNGVDTEKFSDAITDPEKHINEFLYLGKLAQNKGIYDLIDAVENAKNKNDKLKFYIAGDGEVNQVKEIILKKNLSKYFEVVGWVDFNEKINLLKKCSTLVLPSYYEGLPVSILEGMAAGKTIISTTVGAIPEVVKEENGILIQPGDIEALSQSILICASDIKRQETISRNNVAKINKDFSLEVMHYKLSCLYDSILKD